MMMMMTTRSFCLWFRPGGGLAKARLVGILSGIALLTFDVLLPLGASSFAQDAISNQALKDGVEPEIDRDQWRERALNDDSLRQGDIVSTNKGLFVFRGRSDHEHRESDFIPLPPR
jgi:hypothetical protein